MLCKVAARLIFLLLLIFETSLKSYKLLRLVNIEWALGNKMTQKCWVEAMPRDVQFYLQNAMFEFPIWSITIWNSKFLGKHKTTISRWWKKNWMEFPVLFHFLHFRLQDYCRMWVCTCFENIGNWDYRETPSWCRNN